MSDFSAGLAVSQLPVLRTYEEQRAAGGDIESARAYAPPHTVRYLLARLPLASFLRNPE